MLAKVSKKDLARLGIELPGAAGRASAPAKPMLPKAKRARVSKAGARMTMEQLVQQVEAARRVDREPAQPQEDVVYPDVVEVILENIVPVPKERQRFGGGFVYTSPRTRAFEKKLVAAGKRAMGNYPLLVGPIAAEIIIMFPIPKGWPAKARQEALDGLRMPTRRMDIDNGSKAILDGLNEIVYPDDSSIVELRVRKIYADKPGVVARISMLRTHLGGWKK